MADILDRYLQAQSLSATKLSVWSLVVTIFGDAIAPRGGVLRLGALQQITDHIGVGSNALRTAMSRLASDGWLERERIGRASYYRPSSMAAHENIEASKTIYRFFPPEWDGNWIFALESSGEGFDPSSKSELHKLGFAFHNRKLALAPRISQEIGLNNNSFPNLTFFEARTIGNQQPEQFLDQISRYHDCEEMYLEFAHSARELQQGLEKIDSLSDIDAMLLRTLLLHQWRRIVLKDLHWPKSLYQSSWPGFEAQALMSEIYHKLLEPSETWLSSLDATPNGKLPQADQSIYQRFKL